MSAEVLREAARLMRAGEGWPLDADEFALAVAGWLEDLTGPRLAAPADRARALSVAHAYLGESA